MRFPRVLLLALSLGTLVSCAGPQELAKDATTGAIDASVDGIAAPQNQERVIESIEPKRVEEATRRVGVGVVGGTLDALSDPEIAARLSTFATSTMQPVARAMGAAMADAIGAALSRAFTEETKQELRQAVRAVVDDVVTQTFESVNAQLGPKEERDAAIGATVRAVAHGAALGFQDAVDESTKKKEQGDVESHQGNVLPAMNSAAEAAPSLVWIVAGVAAGLLLAIVALLVGRRRHRAAVAERDAALLLMAQAIKSTEDRPWVGELREALRDAFRDTDGADYMRKLMRANPELRLRSANVRGATRPLTAPPPNANRASGSNGQHVPSAPA